MQKMIGLFATVWLFGAAAMVAAEMTICDLQRPNPSRNEIVTVKGRFGFTSHGIFLLSGGCKGKAEDAVVLFPGTAGTPAVHFTLDPRAVTAFGPYMRPAGGTATACGVIRGEVVHKNVKTRSEAGGPQGNGFGPRGAFSLAVVIQSVTEIAACK